MMTLAATGAAAQTLRRISTPVSPAPPARSKAARTLPPTTGMTLSPARVTVAVGGAVQLTASRKSRAGVTLPGNEITWASTDTAVATVSDSGLVTAVGPGTAVITATMGMVSATGQVTVTPAEVRQRSRAGVVLAGVLALRAGRLFPILNYETPDPECPVQAVRGADTNPGDSFLNVNVTMQGQASAVVVKRA